MDKIAIKVELGKKRMEAIINLSRKVYQTCDGLITCWSSDNTSCIDVKLYTDGNTNKIRVENVYKDINIQTSEIEIIKKFEEQFQNEYLVESY